MLEELKDRIIQVARQAQRDGLCQHKSGNFSMRDAETGYLVITPSGVDREQLTTRDMVVMDMDANVVENESGLKPSSECLMHIAIYKTRPDLHAIVHTHSKYATVFAILNKPIPPITYEAFHLGLTKGRIPVAPYGRPGTMALADSVVESAGEADCFLLQAHGDVAADRDSIEEAYLKACYVEEIAELYYLTLTANHHEEPPALPASELQKWAYPKEIHL